MTVTHLFYLSGSFAALLGIFTAFKAGRFISRWAFVVGMLILSAESFCSAMASQSTAANEFLRWEAWGMAMAGFLPGIWLLFALSYARGNTAEFLKSWGYSVAVALLLALVWLVYFRSGMIEAVRGQDSVITFNYRWPATALNVFLLGGSIVILMNLERTFRASVGTMRWRIKFMLLGVAFLFVVRLYTCTQALLFHQLDTSRQSLDAAALVIACLLILRSLFRAGHFSLAVYPSRAILQNSLTFVLAGVYLLVVGILAKLVSYFGGDSAFALKAFLILISLVVLAVLLQSDRARLQVRHFISRNFQRPTHDYRLTWKKFSEGTALRVEQTDLCRSIVGVTAGTFEVLSVTLWIIDDKKQALVLGGSTSLAAEAGAKGQDQPELIDALAKFFKREPDPINLDLAKGAWAEWLRQLHPLEFQNGGYRVCVPMIGRGELIGLIILGDRVGGQPFSLQDFDLLKSVGDHAAGSVMNAQLSQKLVQAKEIEAFQTMATFFVHDLKNAASTLHLMLQNLPVHFNDPVFREDALRGVAKSVNHINRLVTRLSHLRKDLKIQPTTGRLSEVIDSAVTDIEAAGGIQLVKKYSEIPPLLIDREEFSKVVTNFVINAREAMGGKGIVILETRLEDEWAVLNVIDSGCGMSADFLQKSLFRPFQTTKQNGLGIGMFQSKMIVEAHGGRVTVASEVGRGTTFQIFMPRAAGVK